MSLGLTFGSFGDFLALVQVANKIRKEFIDAPSQFSKISAEVRSLAIILQDLEINVSAHQLDGPQQANLAEISKNCNDILQDLEKMVEKYKLLEYSGRDLGKHAKKIWKRLRWEPEDVKELRERITSNITMLNAFQTEISSHTILETKQGVDQLNRRHDDKERIRILDWLSKVDYAIQQNDFMGRRQEGTGEWLLNSDKYTEWHQSPEQTLFCPGMPGAGKTICTAIVINDLTMRFDGMKDVGIAYIYCNFRRRDDQRLEDLLLNVLKQLSHSRESLPDDVKALFGLHQERRTRPLFEEVWRTLRSVSRLFRRVFVVVDALDECQADDGCQARLIAELFKLQSECGANIFATSRFTDIVESFRGSLSLEIRATEEDVSKYLDGNLIRLPAFVRRRIDLQEEIRLTIVRLVRGMFLLAQLHLESLIGKKSPKAVRTALIQLPTGTDESVYDQAYKDAMRRIHGQLGDQKDLALQTLSWITCAKRPLTSLELLHALAIEESEDGLDEDNLPEIEDILTACAGLVTTEDESGVVRLVHYTTQEFFERTQKNWFPDAETEITVLCIKYLSFEDFESGVCGSDEALQSRLQSYPLFDYSAKHWGNHARRLSSLCPAVIEFLSGSPNLGASSQALLADGSQYTQGRGDILDGLHLAAYFGLLEAVSVLIADGHEVDIRDTRHRTPLMWSANRGHEDVTRLLLDEGANIEAQDMLGSTSLAWAARNGHAATTRLLLERGANVDAQDILMLTPLRWAARDGYESTCRALLEAGADLEAKDKMGWTPLMFAAASGHESVARLLVGKGADIHARGSEDFTPLLLATRYGSVAISQTLLEKGANIEGKDRNGWTSLIHTAAGGKETVAQLVLDNGADIEARDNYGQTSLIWAARENHSNVLQLLIRNGADTEARDIDGRTALLRAAENGVEANIQLLLKYNTRGRSQEDIHQISLHVASLSGAEDQFARALENGANVNACDETFGTPLQSASSRGYRDFVQNLIDKGADVNFCGGLYGTALQAASKKGHLEPARLLLDNNAEIDLQDEKGQTALHAASEEGELHIVQLLLDRGANTSLRDTSGATALETASMKGHIDVVDLLLQNMADIDLGGEDRETIRSNTMANDSWVLDFDDV